MCFAGEWLIVIFICTAVTVCIKTPRERSVRYNGNTLNILHAVICDDWKMLSPDTFLFMVAYSQTVRIDTFGPKKACYSQIRSRSIIISELLGIFSCLSGECRRVFDSERSEGCNGFTMLLVIILFFGWTLFFCR